VVEPLHASADRAQGRVATRRAVGRSSLAGAAQSRRFQEARGPTARNADVSRDDAPLLVDGDVSPAERTVIPQVRALVPRSHARNPPERAHVPCSHACNPPERALAPCSHARNPRGRPVVPPSHARNPRDRTLVLHVQALRRALCVFSSPSRRLRALRTARRKTPGPAWTLRFRASAGVGAREPCRREHARRRSRRARWRNRCALLSGRSSRPP
jgi:hypothetical protein